MKEEKTWEWGEVLGLRGHVDVLTCCGEGDVSRGKEKVNKRWKKKENKKRKTRDTTYVTRVMGVMPKSHHVNKSNP